MAYFRCVGGVGGGAVLTLTYSSEFYGETITATDGTKTVTKVAPSTGTMDITLPESGTWVISSTISGSTYTTTVEVDIDYTATLEAIPDGSTVLPTDDIQTWLKCAGIRDKTTYTTLADVLADTDTFIALCADSNASDYLARSTTWADGLVPKMTSNTTPSGTASQSSMYDNDNTYGAWRAFNRNPSETDGWTSSTSDSTAWMQYEFPSSVHIGYMKIDMNNRKSSSNRRTFIGNLYVGDDPNNLTEVLHNFEVQFISGTSYEAELIVNATGKYVKIETVQPNIVPSGYNYTALFGVQFYASNNGCISITEDATAMLIVGKYNYCANALLGNSTWASAICNSTYASSVVSALVPIMTSNTTPSGVASSKDIYQSGYEAYKAFDGNSSTNYIAADGLDTKWLQYQSVEKVCVNKVYIKADVNSIEFLRARVARYELLGSNDGTTWSEPIATLSTDDITSFDIEWIIANTDSYTYHRINEVKKLPYGIGYRTVQFYGRTEKNYQGIAIHSAVEDPNIYYMSSGSPVTLCGIASGDTGEIQASALDPFKNTNLTLYSSVAKDPTNLSNDYSKSIRITPNITEIYLMPDKALYWYGSIDSNCEVCSTANGWDSSVTYNTPTFNKNDAVLSNGSGGTYPRSAIGTKYQVTMTKMLNISKAVSGSSVYMGTAYTTGTKTTSQANIQSNTATVYTLVQNSISITDYLSIKVEGANKQGTVCALWYE